MPEINESQRGAVGKVANAASTASQGVAAPACAASPLAASPPAAPPPGKALAAQRGVPSSLTLPGPPVTPPAPDTANATSDVSTHTVHLPDGTTLEAHSGLGANRDNPASANNKNAGTTPAAFYKLSPRESLYHGVAALRLTPISGDTHGRTGLLAHSYMVGPRGDSHGCVVFRNYPAFLQAYNKGQIKQLKVVDHL